MEEEEGKVVVVVRRWCGAVPRERAREASVNLDTWAAAGLGGRAGRHLEREQSRAERSRLVQAGTQYRTRRCQFKSSQFGSCECWGRGHAARPGDPGN